MIMTTMAMISHGKNGVVSAGYRSLLSRVGMEAPFLLQRHSIQWYFSIYRNFPVKTHSVACDKDVWWSILLIVRPWKHGSYN